MTLLPAANRTVLVVDDDIDIREAICAVLQAEGFSTLEAENGEKALCLLRSGERPVPDVMILDLMMPVMDGQQLLDELERDAELSRTPVIIASASRTLPPGRPTLRKPFTVVDLLSLVEGACTAA